MTNKLMRILYLVPEVLPTYRPDVAVLFGKYLPALGIRSMMIGKGGPSSPALSDGLQIEVSNSKGGRLRRELAFLVTCVKHLQKVTPDNFDFIQVRDMVSIGLVATVWARMRGVRFIYWMSFLMCEGRLAHASAAFDRGAYVKGAALWIKAATERWLLYRIVLPSATHIFVQSDAMREYVALKGLNQAKLTAVPMGVDTEALANSSKKPQAVRAKDADPIIGYLGTLDAQRKLGVLIDALVLVRQTIPRCRLLFVGDSNSPADVALLKEKCRRAGLEEAVRFTGWLPSNMAWALIESATVCVSPIPRGRVLDTGSPTKLIEYLAIGIPCIGNDNPDQEIVLTASQAGWLVRKDTPVGYADAILTVLGDLPAARLRAARGPDYVARHRSYRAIAQHTANTYGRLLDQGT